MLSFFKSFAIKAKKSFDAKVGFPISDIALIIFLPLILLLIKPQWIYSGLEFDPWIYLGHMLNLSGHMHAFADQYAASRLSAILPGAILYSFLSPHLANAILHFSLYYLATFALYFISIHLSGRREALVAAVFFGTNFFLIKTFGSDYVDAYIIAYFLGAVSLLICKTEKFFYSDLQILCAGALAFGMFNSNITAIFFIPYLLILACLRSRTLFSIKQSSFKIGIFLVGFLLAFLALSLVGYLLNGRIWLLKPQLMFAASSAPNTSPFHSAMGNWLDQAYWLLIPALVICLVPVAALCSNITTLSLFRSRIAIIQLLNYFYLVLLFLVLFLLQLTGKYPIIQFWFYTNWIFLPLSFIVFGTLLGRSLEKISMRAWFVTLSVCLFACIFSIFAETRTSIQAILVIFFIASITVCSLFLWRAGPIACSLAIIIVFAASNLLAASNFRMRVAFPEEHAEALDIQQSFDSLKRESYGAIVQCANLANRIAPDANIWFWFDNKEKFAPIFNAIACTHWWGFRLINRDFPSLKSSTDMRGEPIRSGSLIMILSQSGTSLQADSVAQLVDADLDTVVLEKTKIESGSVNFNAITLMVKESPSDTNSFKKF